MTDAVLRGLNWGHRRATAPLEAAAAHFQATDGGRIEWSVQPLSGFESGLGPALADSYDLIVFDHPFCGATAQDGLFRPIEVQLAHLKDADFIGASLASYRYGGHLWALPVDGATQTAVYRPDLLDTALPTNWQEVLDLGEKVRRQGRWLGLAALNPHGFLVLAALAANLGSSMPADGTAEVPFDRAVLREAIQLLDALWPLCHKDGLLFNAIDLHEAMSGREDLVYCPVAYAYLTYGEADRTKPLRFGEFPGPHAPYCAGSVLGGTGLGITRSCRDVAMAERFVRMLADGEAQTQFVAHHGQPAHRAAWEQAANDAVMGGAFAATRGSMEQASMRPRFPGYIQFQHACGARVAEYLAGGLDQTGLMDAVERSWRTHRAAYAA
jgi:multiple sugar transport system substrate-binding protein